MSKLEKEPTMEERITAALLPNCEMARINGQWVKGGRYYRVRARNFIRRFAPPILVVLGVAWGFCFRELVNLLIRWW